MPHLLQNLQSTNTNNQQRLISTESELLSTQHLALINPSKRQGIAASSYSADTFSKASKMSSSQDISSNNFEDNQTFWFEPAATSIILPATTTKRVLASSIFNKQEKLHRALVEFSCSSAPSVEKKQEEILFLKKQLNTQFLKAIHEGDIEKVTELLKSKYIDVNLRGKNGEIPLTEALQRPSSKENLAIIQALLMHKNINLNDKSKKGNTPLHVAIEIRDLKKLEMILSQPNVDPNIKNTRGNFPLMIVIRMGKADWIEKFANNKKTDPNIMDSTGQRPLTLATTLSHLGMVQALLKFKKIDLNLPDAQGNYPVTLAAQSTYPKLLEVLLAREADINVKRYDGLTALGVAIQEEQVETIAILLAAKVAKQKELPADAGAELLPAIQLLLSKSQQIALPATIVEWAIRYKHQELLRTIINKPSKFKIFGDQSQFLKIALQTELVEITKLVKKIVTKISKIELSAQDKLEINKLLEQQALLIKNTEKEIVIPDA